MGSKKINVIGLGYIGLPTSLIMAANGLEVIGTDYNKELIASLRNGHTTFKEEGLDELFFQAQERGIVFQDQYVSCDIYIISVPTPYKKKEKTVDMSYIEKAVISVMEVCQKGAIIIIESTVSPGSIDKFVRPLLSDAGFVIGQDIHLAHAPERIIPGNMIYELQYNSRTIGVDSKQIGEEIKIIYSSFCQGEIILTDIKTAEMSKVIENTYRDVNIAFANEIAKICRADNMNVYEIIKIANRHPRVNILQPGPGVGGHCISVDPWFLVGDYPGLVNIILAARKINDKMPEYVLERISEIMEEHEIYDVSKVGLYGLSYKEDVDDIRESPTLQMIDCMKRHLAQGIKVYDPYVKRDIIPNQFHNLDDFLNSIDMVVILVGHKEIKNNIDKLKNKIVLDTRHVIISDDVYIL